MNRKRSSLTRIWLIPFLALGGLVQSAPAAEIVVESVSPSLLLKAFPAVPKEWKCLQSNGSTDLSVMGVSITHAVRRYELPADEALPKPTPPDGVPAPPPTLRITAFDLGSRQEDPNIRAAAAKLGEKAYRMPGLTGTLRTFPTRSTYTGIGEKRLMLQVEGQGMDEATFRKTLESMDFSTLVASEKQFPTTPIPSELQTVAVGTGQKRMTVYTITNETVDELNPATNRTWKGTRVDPAD